MGEAKRKRERGDRPEPRLVDWFQIEFLDSGREPKVAPNPDYPEGIDFDSTGGDPVQSCKVALPYPAPRCGIMMMQCRRCGFNAGATVAGRPDDPRSIRVPCNPVPGATGRYPDGISKRADDQGEITFAVSSPDQEGNIHIDFGKEVSWIALPKDKVVLMALSLLRKAGIDVKMESEPAKD